MSGQISTNVSNNINSITPWEVRGKVDYYAQIKQFGTKAVEGELIKRWEKVTKMKAHTFIRRGLVFSHQDLDKILDCVEQGVPVYVYTGRGPSSPKMHLGHLIPFKLARYLQQALNCIVVVQLSDDEKYLFKEGNGPEDLEKYRQYGYSNAKDIIACGFDQDKTLIFSNLEKNSGSMYFNNILLMKANNMSTVKATYGLGETLPQSVHTFLKEELSREESKDELIRDSAKIDDLRGTLKKFSGSTSSSIGQCVWPVFQSSPAFCTSFREVFVPAILNTLKTRQDLPANVVKMLKKVLKELTTLGATQSMMCLVPMAIDQAPYFRMARDSAPILRCPKPAVIHSEFLPSLQEASGKMSTTCTTGSTGASGASNANYTLFLDMNIKDVSKVIKKFAFSGGGETMEEHQKYGGNIKVDVCYQYLMFFLDDDEKLREIARTYTAGTLGSGQLKEFTANIISNVISEHQRAKKDVTDSVVKLYFDWSRTLNIGGCFDREDVVLDDDETYNRHGINFDRSFGFSSRPKPVQDFV
ncbi:tryptophanyl-tRNA synthetase [Yasminevirus sp. GU-2018]|uniref:tryptophan--tRNA ligase n=1 Tax=Yasminevirus sp. GU-2018 TaxID=2420051 RepID=A0A5K0UA97_9VIRU|nr:tryptophanyl-tRNA synthetase [Yasminevirus sp. GU-2018]